MKWNNEYIMLIVQMIMQKKNVNIKYQYVTISQCVRFVFVDFILLFKIVIGLYGILNVFAEWKITNSYNFVT